MVVSADPEWLESGTYSQFDSLSTRLEYLCRAADKVNYFSLKRANNHTQAGALYHFGYMILLITGIFDDLAWIINYRYSLGLSGFQVMLKKDRNNKTNKKLYQALHRRHKILHEYLTSSYVQQNIAIFYPLRDAITHRAFVKGFLQESKGVRRNLYEIPEQLAEAIKAASLTGNGVEWGMWQEEVGYRYSIELYQFTKQAFQVTAEIVNSILNFLDWDEVLGSLPAGKQQQVKHSQARFVAVPSFTAPSHSRNA